MSKKPQSWSEARIVELVGNVHSTLRTFTETYIEVEIGTKIRPEHSVHDEYETYRQSVWSLHNYLYPEEP